MHNILQMTGLGEDAEWKIVGTSQNLENTLTDPSLYLRQVGQINLHYTCHHVTTSGQRDFASGEWLFFDFDKIQNYTPNLALSFANAVALALDIDVKHLWVVSSGHGVHVLLRVPAYDLNYLEIHKSTYTQISVKISELLPTFGLTAVIDPIFHKSKSLRLPHTINRKENTPDTKCELIQKGEFLGRDILTEFRLGYDAGFNLDSEKNKRAAIVAASPKNHALVGILGKSNFQVSKIAPKEDIMKNCSFMTELQNNLAYLPRDQWLKGVSLLSSLNMEDEAHAWSSNSATYKVSETEEIIVSAKEKDLKPASCDKIIETFPDLTSKCSTCPFKAFCKTPAKVHNDELNLAASQGFYEYYENKKGEVVRGQIQYKKIADFCNKNFNAMTVDEYDEVYAWNEEKLIYEKKTEHSMAQIFYELINPKLLDSTTLMSKGMNSMKIHHRVKEKEVLPPDGCIPLANGWLDCTTGNLEPYTPERFVVEKIPVNFDPTADCPNFKKFLSERIGDEPTIKMLLQYICYALAGVKMPNRRILVLEGPPATGKTTLIEVFRHLFGNYYHLSALQHLTGRFELSAFENKRLIYFDEAPTSRDELLIEQLKTLSGASEIRIERKNENPMIKQNYARLVISCNEIPRGGGLDAAFLDRLLIIPMHNVITQQDFNVKDNLFIPELSGILNLVLAEYKTLEHNKFSIESTELVREQKAIYQVENDPVAQFMESEIEFVPYLEDGGLYAAKNAVYNSEMTALSYKNLHGAFRRYCEENSFDFHKKMDSKQFNKRLALYIKTIYKGTIPLKTVENARYKYLLGVRFVMVNNYVKEQDIDRF